MKPIFALSLLALPLLASAQSAPQVAGTQIKLPAYQSSFKHYRPFADEPVGTWRDVNEHVRKAGGWSSYAREASQSEAVTVVPAPLHNTPQSGLQK